MRAVVEIGLAWLVVATGCGRLGFGSSEVGDGAVAVGDADTADDAASDGPTADGPTAACPPGLDLCDDFESAALDAVWMADPMVSLDTTRAHRGTTSVHVHMPALAAGSGNYQTLHETQTIT